MTVGELIYAKILQRVLKKARGEELKKEGAG
jgi:hypothetical protein